MAKQNLLAFSKNVIKISELKKYIFNFVKIALGFCYHFAFLFKRTVMQIT